MLEPQLWFVPPELPDQPLLAVLSAQEIAWGEALPALRRRPYWRSRGALRQGLAQVLQLAPAAVPLHSPPGAPPQLPQGLGWLSLSHGGEAALLAWSSQPVGVDLERADRPFAAAAVMQRFFAAAEQRQLQPLAGEALRQAVLRSWICKEAAIKWRRRSLAAELSAWWLDHGSGTLCHGGDGTVVTPIEGDWEGWCWAWVGAGAERVQPKPLTWR